ncbi:hypothetical protein I4U23_000387 [Adineta vaga]|nr:hypothetical protein I4U23_000387 [Adineta vaga]
MHNISTLIFFFGLVFLINVQSSSSSNRYRSCPEEYRELRRRNDDSSSDSDNDDDDDDNNEEWEDLCRVAINAAVQQPQSVKSQALLRTYCPYLDEALELARANNDTLCEMKKRAIAKKSYAKRKRQTMKKKRYDDSSDDDDDDEDKRRALRKRKLHKRFALRFIRKSL